MKKAKITKKKKVKKMKGSIRRTRKGRITTVAASLKIKRINPLLNQKTDTEIAQARGLLQSDLKAENAAKRIRNLQCREGIKADITLAHEINTKSAVKTIITARILIIIQLIFKIR